MQKIAKFSKELVKSARAHIPNDITEVIRDRDEIALALGKATRIDGIIVPKPGADLLHALTASSDEEKTQKTADVSKPKNNPYDFFSSKRKNFNDSKNFGDTARGSESSPKATKELEEKHKYKGEDDDEVLVDDNSSNDSEKQKNRWGKIGSGQPDIVFFEDPDAVNELRRIKEEQHQRRIMAESRNSTIENDISTHRLK